VVLLSGRLCKDHNISEWMRIYGTKHGNKEGWIVWIVLPCSKEQSCSVWTNLESKDCWNKPEDGH
jgi:hypothetical protein